MVLLYLDALVAAAGVHQELTVAILDEQLMARWAVLMVVVVVVAGGRADFVRAAGFKFIVLALLQQALLAQCELSGPGTLELTHLPVQVHLNFLEINNGTFYSH